MVCSAFHTAPYHKLKLFIQIFPSDFSDRFIHQIGNNQKSVLCDIVTRCRCIVAPDDSLYKKQKSDGNMYKKYSV